jgi:hypothetical protein
LLEQNARFARPDRVAEAGKDADFILLSGDPPSVYSKVLETYVEGKKVFDRSDPKDLLFATGGCGPAEATSCIWMASTRRKTDANALDDARIDRFVTLVSSAQVAIRGEKVYTSAGSAIADGVVIIRDGKVEQAGSFFPAENSGGLSTSAGQGRHSRAD